MTIYLMQQPKGGRNYFFSQFEGTQSRDRAAAAVGAAQSMLVGVSGRATVTRKQSWDVTLKDCL